MVIKTPDSIRSGVDGRQVKKEEQEIGGGGKQEGNNNANKQQEFQLSAMRWPTLFAVCVFGFCNGIVNEGSSILQVYVEVVGLKLQEYVYASQLFFFVPFVGSFASAALVDKFGARLAIFSALLMGALRNSARALLFAPHVPGWRQLRLIYWILQRFFMITTVNLYYCLPLRLAEGWFADHERSLALTLLLVTPTLGTACACLVVPHYVHDVASALPLAYVNLTCTGVSIAAVSLFVRRSKPSVGAPSERNRDNLKQLSETISERLVSKLKRILTNTNYIIHLLCLGSFDPLIATIQGILQDIFSSAGLSSIFCGQFLAISSIVAAAMQITCSILLKRTKKPEVEEHEEEIPQDPYRTANSKLFVSLQCLAFVIFAQTLVAHEWFPNSNWLISSQWWLLIITSISYILIRSCAAPTYLEQSAELICGSISEPQAAACSSIVSSVYSNLIALTFVHLRRVDEHNHKRAIYSQSVQFATIWALIATAIFLIKFKPQVLRNESPPASTQRVVRLSLSSNGTSQTVISETTTTTTTTQVNSSSQNGTQVVVKYSTNL